MTVKELISYAYGVQEYRIIDQPYKLVFCGNPSNLKYGVKNSKILSREIETFSISDKNCLGITLAKEGENKVEKPIISKKKGRK